MTVETINRKRWGLSMHSYFLQTGASNRMRRPGLSICSTPDTSIQPNKYEIPKNGISIRTGRGHKILEKKGGQTIIMGDINKYTISWKIRSFTSKLGLWELIISGYGSMGKSTTRGKKVTSNIQNLGITRYHNFTRRVPSLPLRNKIVPQTSVGKNYTLSFLQR